MNKELIKLNEILTLKKDKILELEIALGRKKKQIADLTEENSVLVRDLHEANRVAADQTRWRVAYENMKAFALANGLDIQTTN